MKLLSSRTRRCLCCLNSIKRVLYSRWKGRTQSFGAEVECEIVAQDVLSFYKYIAAVLVEVKHAVTRTIFGDMFR